MPQLQAKEKRRGIAVPRRVNLTRLNYACKTVIFNPATP
jgi:hypothetical protein